MPFMVYLDPGKMVCLHWGFDAVLGNITFKLVVNTTGWVGFGLSPNGGMTGADIVMGGLGPRGSYFSDYYATDETMPLVDTQQSYTLLSVAETNGQTIMTFERTMSTCDPQDLSITTQPIKLIYAYGLTDEITYHSTRRGTLEVNLLNYLPKMSMSNSTYLSVKVDNISIPPVKTYYHCKVMSFPTLTTKHHIYQIEPAIENYDIVHHLLLYKCPPFVTQGYSKPCYSGDIGDVCFGVVAVWGVGGGVFDLPEHAGLPVGGEPTPVFYRLEVHYNNPSLQTGRTDSSGLRLHYTNRLRQYDAGILTTGVLMLSSLEYTIPPKTPSFHTYGVCNTSLFSPLMNPVPEFHVFAVMLHTHLAGRRIRVGHYRNGKQIDFVAFDENYNFEIQHFFNFGNFKTIKPGDEIAVECSFNTTDRSGVTKMGLATTDEMCLAFLVHYPAVSIATCLSHPLTMGLPNTSYELSGYENMLKLVPQYQVVTDDKSNSSYNPRGIIREMMKTPTTSCRNNAPSRFCISSWIPKAAGIILLLLWLAII
ncbi:DBH-like monooxygenase protein 2 homolog isoform X2 [Mastacembelus armatus]|nr:DBH-like monooxygenase protein 2 homolog isoform X2 [Mastacembelus armatus]